MEPSREELTQRLQQVSDAELLEHVQKRTLIPLALEVAQEIIRSRGLERDAGRPDASGEVETGVEPDLGPEALPAGDLVPLAQFLEPDEAGVLRACLESRGIFVHVWGEHLAYAHIILSMASGRTKLLVPRSQLPQAQAILAALSRGELEAPATGPEQALADSETPCKPSPMSGQSPVGRLLVGYYLAGLVFTLFFALFLVVVWVMFLARST